jgi:hypothetical protein
MIKYKWGKAMGYEKSFIIPLVFEMQMVRTGNPTVTLSYHLHKESSGDNSPTT